MHAYLLVLEITPLTVGNTYDMLPLHCTLVHWFWLDQSADDVVQQLTKALSGTGPILLQAGGEQVFTGKNKNGGTVPVTVNDIELTPELRSLHERACAALETMGVRYAEPQYVHNGYHPHATQQKDGKLAPGEARTAARAYAVSASAPEYGNKRTVQAVIRLSR